MNTYFTKYYREVILILLLLLQLFFLTTCSNTKKKNIIHNPDGSDLLMFYMLTEGGGASLMNSCERIYKYEVIRFNQVVTGNMIQTYYRINNLSSKSQVVIKNLNSDANCEVKAFFNVCDLLNNEITSSKLTASICSNLMTNKVIVNYLEKEKTCILNYELLNYYQNSLTFGLRVDKISESNNNCSYIAEVLP